jgi:hypothetical protein
MNSHARHLIDEAFAEPANSRLWEFAQEQRLREDYASIPLTAKLWIFPDGHAQPLNGEMHDTWLQSHRPTAQKYGVTDSDLAGDHQAVRLNALRRGLTRVAYELRYGHLVFEGNAKYWRGAVKNTAYMIVADNIDKIDRITVTLFDDHDRVWKSENAELFSYADDREKLDHLPGLFEGLRARSSIRKLIEGWPWE